MTTAEKPADSTLQAELKGKRGLLWSTVTTLESRVSAGFEPRSERTLVGRVYELI